MTWRTHALAGAGSVWLMAVLPGGIAFSADVSNPGLLAAVAALGALLPDLDAAESKIKHLSPGWGITPFSLPSLILHRAFGHRGLLHSAAGLALFTFLFALPLGCRWGWQLSLALTLGYASHLAADACTRTGIPFLYPNRHRYFLPPTLPARRNRLFHGRRASATVRHAGLSALAGSAGAK